MKKLYNQIENIETLEKVINKYIGGREAAEAIKWIKEKMETEKRITPFFYFDIGKYMIDCLEFKFINKIFDERDRLIGRKYRAEGVIIYEIDDDNRFCNLIINTYKNNIWAA